MFRSFILWLDDYMAGEDPSSLLKSLIGLMSFAVLLGAVIGNTAVKAGGLVTVLLFVVFVILALISDRRRLKRHKEKNRRLVARYCDVVMTRLDWAWRITKWDQTIKINSNGDTTQTISVHAIAECDYLDFFALKVGAGWSQPEKYRRRVKLKVRTTGLGGRDGPKCDVTTTWTSDHKLEALIHLPSPVERDAEFRVVAVWNWPAKCRPLMTERAAEEFCIKMRCATEHIRYAVLLPEKANAYYLPIGFIEGEQGYAIKRTKLKSGVVQVVFSATSVEAARRVGLRLELK